MAIGNIPARKRGFGYDPVTRSLGVYVDGALAASFPPSPGRTYFVNNISGASTNDGLSWANAMDEVSTAITASEAYRALGYGMPDVSTNDYVRNTIMVQGTGTGYTAITALPSYTIVVGLGADPRGNGAGIPSITGAGAADAASGSARGLDMYNMQFTQSAYTASYGLDLAVVYRSRFENCAFMNSGSGGMRVVTGGSLYINECFFGMDANPQAYGLYVTGGANFNACTITNSEFYGEDAGVYILVNNCKQTIFKNCIAALGSYGFQDASVPDSNKGAFFYKCYGHGTAAATINGAGFKITTNYADRAIGCIENAAGVLYNYPTTSD